jgi:O-acetyl-ADP-ribose deacetylase (regulator of RNase III)
MSDMSISLVSGDLLDQKVEVIVNAWNRNVIPWWLLLPQGVSGAIKKRGGYAPFRELAKHGPIAAGGARMTTAGRLPFKGIIHVAGINLAWRSSVDIVTRCVMNSLNLAREHAMVSVAMPLIGAGTGGLPRDLARATIIEAASRSNFCGEIVVVEFRRNK